MAFAGPIPVTTPDAQSQMLGVGSVRFAGPDGSGSFCLRNVGYVPGAVHGLLSIAKVIDAGYTISHSSICLCLCPGVTMIRTVTMVVGCVNLSMLPHVRWDLLGTKLLRLRI